MTPARRSFGKTWWGKAWIDALEHRARLDPNRLPRGRTYARTGRVGSLAVGPGEVRAPVKGSRTSPYQVHVRVRMFEPAEWDRLLDAVAAKAAHTAALLDGELPPEVVADAAGAGVELLPGPGDIGPRCSCPDWADPCKHSAAVIYLVAEVLDADPFVLLLLRGRSREDVLAGLRQRRAAAGAGGGGAGVGARGRPARPGRPADPGVEARLAWARVPPDRSTDTAAGSSPASSPASLPAVPTSASSLPASLPAVPLPPRHPGQPAPLAVDPPASSGLTGRDLAALAADAAERAWALCNGEGDGGLTLDPEVDVVRRAAVLLRSSGRRGFEELAARAGQRPADLGRAARAWRIGGPDALEVMEGSWPAPPDALDEGRAALEAAGLRPARPWHNRLTVGAAGVQLRLSRSGRWYRCERAGTGWELVDGPEADPLRLLAPHSG